MCMCVCVCVYVHVKYVYVCVCMCMCVHACVYMCVWVVYVSVCLCVYVCVYVCVCMWACVYVSQLLRVDPSALASSLPGNGWRPANRGGPGATHVGVTFIPFLLGAGSTRHDREGGSCSVLYSDPSRAVDMPVP